MKYTISAEPKNEFRIGGWQGRVNGRDDKGHDKIIAECSHWHSTIAAAHECARMLVPHES